MTLVTREDKKAVIRPAGDKLVAASISGLRSEMRGIVEEGIRELVVDMSDIRMVDSMGIGLLISAHNTLRKLGGKLAIVHASGEILQLFQGMRMHQHFSVSGN